MPKSIKDNNAFSLIDVVMAITVISVGLVGVMSLVIQNITAGRENKNFLVASMLAQEGLELVRNVRDSNWLDSGGAAWYDGIYSVSPTTFTIYKDGKSTIDSVAGIDNAVLYIDSDNFYVHSGAGGSLAATEFKRLITVTGAGPDPDNITVSAKVQWPGSSGAERVYEAVTNLYDWR